MKGISLIFGEMSEVSILLGAGFSAPMGYPLGGGLNKLLLECDGSEFRFHTNGLLVPFTGGSQAFAYRTSYDKVFEAWKVLRDYFNQIRGSFVKNIFQQVLSHFIKDRNGKRYYDDEPYLAGTYYPGYTGFMNCLRKLSQTHTVHIHTLNHDLFFESFNNSDFLEMELSDGFEELGSDFYGELEVNGRTFKVRLSRYTGRYDTKFRLYKLHGSLDYCVHFEPDVGESLHKPRVYLKTRYGIGVDELIREVTNPQTKEKEYFFNDSNYNADYLTGTTSKIERYKEPLLYKKLFSQFEQNLKKSKLLLIAGYGARDTEINRILTNHFDSNYPSHIIDPNPGSTIKDLQGALKSNLISEQIENITAKILSF